MMRKRPYRQIYGRFFVQFHKFIGKNIEISMGLSVALNCANLPSDVQKYQKNNAKIIILYIDTIKNGRYTSIIEQPIARHNFTQCGNHNNNSIYGGKTDGQIYCEYHPSS